MKKLRFGELVASLVLITVVLGAAEKTSEQPEFAKLPYAVVCKIVNMPAPGSSSNQTAGIRIRIVSQLPNVTAKDITLFIDSKTGRLPIPLQADGSCVIPSSAALLAENPFIMSNQPKGSLTLLGYYPECRLAVPPNNIVKYRDLMKLIILARKAKTIVGEAQLGTPATYLESQLIRVQDHGRINVFIQTKTEKIGIDGGEDGLYQIPYRSDWLEDNPDVILPGQKAWIVGLPETPPSENANLATEKTDQDTISMPQR